MSLRGRFDLLKVSKRALGQAETPIRAPRVMHTLKRECSGQMVEERERLLGARELV